MSHFRFYMSFNSSLEYESFFPFESNFFYSSSKFSPGMIEEKIYIKPLGAGNEVGRSCIHLKYGNKEFLLDCGVHPAYTGVSSLPFLDLVDLSKIDAILITHFHLDHAAALPFLTEKTEFKGKVYMTHPTKVILKWLLNDYIRIINSSSEQDFYTEKDLQNCYDKIIPIDYHQQINIKGIKFILIEIEKAKLLYTGDFSREEDRHLKAAESPGCRMDALITESTYGVQCHLPRSEREARFTSIVSNVVERGGRCLLPVFALGRAQELLLILEEYWDENPHLKGIPIYYASALAQKCMSVYQTYINMMNERIQKLSLVKNPFDFRNVECIKDIQAFKDTGPCVMMASPGMLQSGFSRELFEKWCSNDRNGIVIPGYCVEGTLAKEILSEPKEVESMKGGMLKLNMSVEYIIFSAHVDYTQNIQFIDECKPHNLFFVHGEVNEMMRLRNSIQMRNEKNKIEMNLFTLKNGEEGSFDVIKENEAKIYSDKLGEYDALMVVSNDEIGIYDQEDLNECEFKKVNIVQKQAIPFNSTSVLLRQILFQEFEAEDKGEYLVVGNVKVSVKENEINLEWGCNYLDDVIAMSIHKCIKEIGQSIKTVRMSRLDEFETLFEALKGYFPDVQMHDGFIKVDCMGKQAMVSNKAVTGNDDDLVTRISDVLEKKEKIALINKIEYERKVREREEQERRQQERINYNVYEHFRREDERKENERREQEKRENERREREKRETERKENERREQARRENERREQARRENERKENERREQARIENERREQEKRENERKENERKEQERQLQARRVQARIENERREQEKREIERMENKRKEQERQVQARREEERQNKELMRILSMPLR